MSSSMYLINWATDKVDFVLNNASSPVTLKVSSAQYSYLPYSYRVDRSPSEPPSGVNWGEHNSLVITQQGSGQSQIYNDLKDPEEAAPNSRLQLWIFPDYVIFSQFENQLGFPIYPS